MQGGEDGAAAHLAHGRDREGQVPGGFAARGVDQTQGVAIAQKPRRHLHFAEQPLMFGLGARRPGRPIAFARHFVQRRSAGQHLHEHQGRALPHGVHDDVGRAQRLVVVREHQLEALGDGGSSGGAGHVLVRPAQEVPEEREGLLDGGLFVRSRG